MTTFRTKKDKRLPQEEENIYIKKYEKQNDQPTRSVLWVLQLRSPNRLGAYQLDLAPAVVVLPARRLLTPGAQLLSSGVGMLI